MRRRQLLENSERDHTEEQALQLPEEPEQRMARDD